MSMPMMLILLNCSNRLKLEVLLDLFEIHCNHRLALNCRLLIFRQFFGNFSQKSFADLNVKVALEMTRGIMVLTFEHF